MSKPVEIYGRPWKEPEYIIVLQYYVLHRGDPRHHLCDYVIEAARLIGRTPAAVVMRMENYASLDPQEKGIRKGLVNLGALGAKVFNEWINKPEALRACADMLMRDVQASNQPTLFDPDPIRLPRAFGKYELLDQIGDGGFGSVYSCINSETQQIYAMKIMRMDALQDNELLGRCRREIKALKAFSHPNIIAIHEDNLDEQRDYPGFVMDLAEASLTSYIQSKTKGAPKNGQRPRLPYQETVDILSAIMNAVQALHEHAPALIHRDLNPNNILRMEGGRWVLADFSLAKFLMTSAVSTTFATKTHQAWGTVHYTAPEQWQDFSEADQRADIYSIGVLIWELLSPSWPPLDRSHLMLSPAVERVVLKATSRDRELRHRSVAELRTDITTALAEDNH